jgi:hypothetical protein
LFIHWNFSVIFWYRLRHCDQCSTLFTYLVLYFCYFAGSKVLFVLAVLCLFETFSSCLQLCWEQFVFPSFFPLCLISVLYFCLPRSRFISAFYFDNYSFPSFNNIYVSFLQIFAFCANGFTLIFLILLSCYSLTLRPFGLQ